MRARVCGKQVILDRHSLVRSDGFVVYVTWGFFILFLAGFFFQAEDGIRDLVRSRGLGDVYKRQA